MKTKTINNATDKLYNEMLKDKSIQIISYDSKISKLVIRQKTEKFVMKVAFFDIDLKHNKPYRVRLSVNNGNVNEFNEFEGKTCVQDFVKEIFRKKYRGYKFFPLDKDSECVHILSKYFKRHKFDVNLGVIGIKCIYIKLYLRKYFNKNGVISHSDVITFLTTGV